MKDPIDLKLVTIGEIAQWLGVSIRTVQRNEQVWGLTRIRTRTGSVWYRRNQAVEALSRLGSDRFPKA